MSRRAAPLAAALSLALALAGCPAPRPIVRPAPPKPPVGTGEGRPPPSGAPARAQRPLPVPLAATEYHEEPEVVGVVHLVRRGETIYRIARAYGVDQADLLEVNGIADPRQVATGTELFVPGASRVVDLEEVTGSAPARSPAPGAAHPAAPLPAPVDGHPVGPPPAPAPGATPPPAPAPTPGPPSAGAHGGKLAWPLKGVLYGRYGVRSGRRHDGIDLAAPEGSVIGAAAAGTVIFAGEQAGYGSIVILRHADGLVTLYAHCSAVLVDEGAAVKRGQPIAKVGQTGRTSGPHLHFEVREGTRPRNPLLFLP